MKPFRIPSFLLALAAPALACVATSVQAESLTLRKIRETGVITLGYRDGSIPFSYLDDRQRPIGYSMDLCQAIVGAVRQRLRLDELRVKLVPVTSSTRIPMVANGQVDLECGTTTNTVERQKHVAFLLTTFVAHSRIAIRRDSSIGELVELRGRPVASTAGTTSMALLSELNAGNGLGLNIVPGKDHAQSFRLLATGRADAFAMDDVLLHALVATSGEPARYAVVGSPLSVEPYGIALRRDDPEFRQLGNDTLAALFRSGRIRDIYRRWFESPIPPYQVRLDLPMSASLRRAIDKPTDSGDPASYR